MDYVQHAFYNASNWNYENSYSHLTATARGMETPLCYTLNLADGIKLFLILKRPAAYDLMSPLSRPRILRLRTTWEVLD